MTWRAPLRLVVARKLTSLTSKPAREGGMRPRRPHGEHTARPQRPADGLQSLRIIERIIGLADQALRPVVDIEQDRIERGSARPDHIGNIGLANVDARVL